MKEDYLETFDDFWAELVTDEHGNLVFDAIARELHDYRTLLKNVPQVYDHVTGGKVTKPMTDPEVVKSLFDDYVQEHVDDAVEESKREQ